MSKRFEKTFPKLSKAIQDDKVMSITDDDGEGIYITYDLDGKEKVLGKVGYEKQIEDGMD